VENRSLTLQNFEMLDALKCVISYNEYGGYCIPLSSQNRPAARIVLNRYVYEPDTIAYIRGICSGGDIVHAGAYFGDFLPALSQGCDPGAKVWAFEPNTENYRCATITILINGLENVILHHSGLGARRDQLELLVTDENGQARGGMSTFLTGDSKDMRKRTETVPVNTIDEIIPTDRPVSIIHLDVEGYEKEALIGAMNTIKRCFPILLIEILEGRNLVDGEWFAEQILSLGYRNIGKVHGNEIFSHDRGIQSD
jgi:FkbM family methyltransferase